MALNRIVLALALLPAASAQGSGYADAGYCYGGCVEMTELNGYPAGATCADITAENYCAQYGPKVYDCNNHCGLDQAACDAEGITVDPPHGWKDHSGMNCGCSGDATAIAVQYDYDTGANDGTLTPVLSTCATANYGSCYSTSTHQSTPVPGKDCPAGAYMFIAHDMPDSGNGGGTAYTAAEVKI
jgi:hypothetical protein